MASAGERAEQAALADAGLADQEHELPAAAGSLVEGLGQSRTVRVSSEQWRVLTGQLDPGGDVAAPRGSTRAWRLLGLDGMLAQQLQIELLGLGFWLAAQLPLQQVDTGLVLLERS